MSRTKRTLPVAALSMAAGLALLAGCATTEGEEVETMISMGDLPAAVRTSAEKELGGIKVLKVERMELSGRTRYAVSYFDEHGHEMELLYDVGGTLLARERQ